MSELRFDDRVAIVTGAGGGLGRSHALLLASRGAKVVVNDLGGSFSGEGASSKMADVVVKEITNAGGVAVANYDSVEDGDKIVATAVENFGRVDIVVNNAGILRDVSFQKMTQTDWDLIYKVHVLGSFRVTHAAWPHMREAGYGRIIMTASAAGIYGNFGQANYSMAKLGLAGFANTLAIEGMRKNIVVNTIAPLAGSRMTETVLPPALIEALLPEYVSPLVGWLCHEDCEDSGGLYEVGGGYLGKLRWERSAGKTFRLGRGFGPEEVQTNWKQIAGFEKVTHPGSVAEAMAPIIENVEAGPSSGGNEFIDVDEALGFEFPVVESRYTENDLALYALGVGAATDPTDDADLRLVYEMHGKGMKALPTFGVIPPLSVMMSFAKEGKQAPGLNYSLDRLLHGEQYTELSGPLPLKATLKHKARIKNIVDKGKHALVVTEVESRDESGELLVKNEFTSLIRGAGGWDENRKSIPEVNVPPDRKPDAVVEERIPANQALLYRLTGDWNPLHADPGFAKAFGFDKPILHGLCTFGFASRAVIAKFAPDGDPGYFKSIRTRFADSVFPGETLITEMWKDGQRIVFRSKVKERDSVVISNAAIEMFKEIPVRKLKPAAKSKPTGKAQLVPNSGDIFRAMGKFVGASSEIADKVKTVFQFALSVPASVWTIDLEGGGPGSVHEGESKPAKCKLEMSDIDFMAMATGKADPMKLFSTGKLKISGDVMASQKLGFLKKITPEMVLAETRLRGGDSDENGAPTKAAPSMEPTSWDVFIAIRDHIARHPEIVGKVSTVYLFKLTSPDSAWTVDVKNGIGGVTEGDAGAADCTLEISDSDFIAMTKGEADPMKLFTTGKLKISGNVMASQKLDFLQKIDPEEAKAAVIAARSEGQGPSAQSSGSTSSSTKARATEIFDALTSRLKEKPALAKDVGTSIQFAVTDPRAAWHVELSTESPVVSQKTAAADTTLTVTDADLAELCRDKVSARDLFLRGRMRVDGDLSVAHRLGFLKGLL